MKTFFEVAPVLEQGRAVRMSRWEPTTVMVVDDGKLVCRLGTGAQYDYAPSWREMQAKKWSVI